MKFAPALESASSSMRDLAIGLRRASEGHAAEPDIRDTGRILADRCVELARALAPFSETYGASIEAPPDIPSQVATDAHGANGGSAMLLQDLRSVSLLAHGCEIDWVILHQAAMAARDVDLVDIGDRGMHELRRVTTWLKTRIKDAAPQILMSG